MAVASSRISGDVEVVVSGVRGCNRVTSTVEYVAESAWGLAV